MNWEDWISFVILASATITTPGPGNLNTLRRAVELGHRSAYYSMLGNVVGLAILGAATGLGLVAILAASPRIWLILQWIGIGFLFFLAVQMIIKSSALPFDNSAHRQRAAFWLFGEAFCVSVLNPKAAIFFLAVFPLFVDPARSIPLQTGQIVVTCMAISAMSHLVYIVLARWTRQYLSQPHRYRAFRVISGLIMLAIASWLLMQALIQPSSF